MYRDADTEERGQEVAEGVHATSHEDYPGCRHGKEQKENEKKPVQMMFNVSTFKMTYIGEIFTQILVLPYAGKELNMIIMLPDENTNLKMVEEELSYEKFIE